MKIKMLSILAGPKMSADAGAIIDVDDDYAKALIAANHASPIVAVETEPETADAAPQRRSKKA